MDEIKKDAVIQLLGFNVNTSIALLSSRGNKTIVNTINPHSYCTTKKDDRFHLALQESDVLLPDGFGIVLAAKFLKGKQIEKIAGYDVFLHLMNDLNENKGSCFFLGAAQETLKRIETKIHIEFPNVTVASFSPPYKAEFTKAESAAMLSQVNQFNPDVLFVGMTAPKQEKWVHEYKNNLDATIICSIGAVFDFYAGNVKRPSQFWINLGLEWLPRFLKEPKRLAERNLISTPKFLLELLWFKIFKKGIL